MAKLFNEKGGNRASVLPFFFAEEKKLPMVLAARLGIEQSGMYILIETKKTVCIKGPSIHNKTWMFHTVNGGTYLSYLCESKKILHSV